MNEQFEGIAIVGYTPAYTPYGYVIGADAIIYSLLQLYGHGAVTALLYPDIALAQGYAPPDRDYDGFYYQGFELDNHRAFPIIRVAIGMMYSFNVSKGEGLPTAKQLHALTLIMKEQDVSLSDTVQQDGLDTSARKLLKNWEDTERNRPPVGLPKPRTYDDES